MEQMTLQTTTFHASTTKPLVFVGAISLPICAFAAMAITQWRAASRFSDELSATIWLGTCLVLIIGCLRIVVFAWIRRHDKLVLSPEGLFYSRFSLGPIPWSAVGTVVDRSQRPPLREWPMLRSRLQGLVVPISESVWQSGLIVEQLKNNRVRLAKTYGTDGVVLIPLIIFPAAGSQMKACLDDYKAAYG